MTELDKKWISEASPLGPPADPGNNTPISGKALEDLEQRIRNEIADPAALPSSVGSVSAEDRLRIQANRAPAVARVLDHFLSSPAGVGVGRSGTTYSLYVGIYPGLFSKFDLVSDSSELGGYALRQLQKLTVIAPMLSKAYGDESVASGGTWTTGANAGAYNGGYTYSTEEGATKTFTSPACTALGMRVPKLTNGGRYAKVVIDEDATRARSLPTVQEEVDAGRLDSSVLVENEGTLNPTDRVFNSYVNESKKTDYDVKVALAVGLADEAHTVVVEDTGYALKGVEGAQRLYLAGFSYGTGTTEPGDENTVIITVGNLSEQVSAWSHAAKFLPTAGGETATFLGNVHGYEVEDALAVTVDGSAKPLEDGEIAMATREAAVTRKSHLLHPDTGETKIADVKVVYTAGRNGLTIRDVITWDVAGALSASYSMCPLNGATSNVSGATKFSRGQLLDRPGAALTLTGESGDSYYGNYPSAAAWSWGGYYGVLVHMPAVEDFTDDWANSTYFTRIEDREGNMTKIYFGRLWGDGPTVTIAPGDVQEHTTTITVCHFAEGAEGTLAAL